MGIDSGIACASARLGGSTFTFSLGPTQECGAATEGAAESYRLAKRFQDARFRPDKGTAANGSLDLDCRSTLGDSNQDGFVVVLVSAARVPNRPTTQVIPFGRRKKVSVFWEEEHHATNS
jgi:hypothetical protein